MKRQHFGNSVMKNYVGKSYRGLIPLKSNIDNIVGSYSVKTFAASKRLNSASYFKDSTFSTTHKEVFSQCSARDSLEDKLKESYASYPAIHAIQQKAHYSTSPILLEIEKEVEKRGKSVGAADEPAKDKLSQDKAKAEDNKSQSSDSKEGANNGQNRDSETKPWDYLTKFMASIGFGMSIYNLWQWKYQQQPQKLRNKQEEIERKLDDYSKIASRDHSSKGGVKAANTNEYAKQIIEQVWSDPEILKYFQGQRKIADVSVTPDTLIKLAHCCNSAATNRLYNLKDFQGQLRQVREMLEHKILAEKPGGDIAAFIAAGDMRNAKIYLQTFGEGKLQVEYTILTYIHARGYIYKYGADKSKYYALPLAEREKIKQEFRVVEEFSNGLSDDLGRTYKLLEHISSQRNGLNIIRDWEISEALEKGDKETAKRLIAANIASYKQIRDDGTEYIIEYELGKSLEEQNKKSLQGDSTNFLICEKQLIKYYGSWVAIADTEAQKAQCLSEFEQVLVKAKEGELKILNIIKDAKISPNDQAAAILSISSSLLSFYKAGIDIGKACELIKEQLSELMATNGIRVEGITDELQLIAGLAETVSSTQEYYRHQVADIKEQLETLEPMVLPENVTDQSQEVGVELSGMNIKTVEDTEA